MKKRYIFIGFIVLVSILILVVGLDFLKGKSFFAKQDYYYIVYNRINGLNVSNPVMINGYKIGQVQEIKLIKKPKVRLLVKFILDSKIDIPKKSIAKIYSLDLMGTKGIELILSQNAKIMQVGDTLLPKTEETLKEQVSIQMLPLKNKAEDMLAEMENAIKVIRIIFNEEARENIKNTLNNINKTSVHLNSSATSIDSLLINERVNIHKIVTNIESISANLKNNNNKINNIISSFSKITDSLTDVDLKLLFKQLDSTIDQTNKIINNINQGTGTLNKLIYNDSLYYSVNSTGAEVAKLVHDIKENPKRYLHFSLFDWSKDKNSKQKAKYNILINISKTPISIDEYESLKNVQEVFFNNSYYYIFGNFRKLHKAEKMLIKIKKKFPEARIIDFNNE